MLRYALAPSLFSGLAAEGLVGIGSGVGQLTWQDWDRRQVCHPMDFSSPSTEAELIDIVAASHMSGEQLKVVGAGHSFSAIALTDGHMVSVDKMNKILDVDGTAVRAQGGIRLFDFNAQLEVLGLSLENLGATCHQSLAGVTATGTHGTGRLIGNTASRIEALRIVAANGTVHVVSKDDANLDLFNAARVGLGSLGVISEMTIRTLPLFHVKLTNVPMNLDQLISNLPDLMQRYERLQWFWDPPNETATVVIREVTEEPITEGGCWGDAGAPHLPAVAAGAMLGLSEPVEGATQCVDVSYKGLCDSQAHYAARKLYTEMEMFVPAEHLLDAIADFRAFQAEVLPIHNPSIDLFTGVRYVAGDDMLLSTAGGRATAVISFIVMGPSLTEAGDVVEFARYAQELESLTEQRYGGRPHWGKKNWATRETMRHSYDHTAWSKFLALRQEMDPKGIFLNDYLHKRLPLDDPTQPSSIVAFV